MKIETSLSIYVPKSSEYHAMDSDVRHFNNHGLNRCLFISFSYRLYTCTCTMAFAQMTKHMLQADQMPCGDWSGSIL